MEQAILPPAYNPHLKKVLKSYQDAALKSLSGPSNYVATWGNPAAYSIAELEEYRKAFLSGNLKSPLGGETKDITKESFLAAPALTIQQVPLFLPMDSSRGEKSETILEGETIACFIVGGEKRLCLPQILNTVLQDFTLTQINNICDDLHIFCSRCSPEQLETLKLTAVLPWTAPSCGLITKTDAERLCNALLHANPEKSKEPPSQNSFKVYHECFGKCKGIFNPDLYSTPYAKCIECCDCHGMFAPQKFVCHSHKALENRTCHWGFDSANWRSYLLLAKDQECKHKLQETLDQLKARFDFMSKFKRKQSPSPTRTDEKRKRYDEDSQSSRSGSSSWPEGSRENSAFRPWSPTVLNAFKEQKIAASAMRSLPSYLQKGPPVLLNPERVIPFSDKHRYERNFAPNVSLAPPSQQKDNDDDEDVNVEKKPDEDEDEDKVVVKIETQTDIDVSSDTDTSSLHTESVPSTPQTEPRSEPTVKTESQGDLETLEKEQGRMLEMMREALNATIKEASREKFIQEFIKLQVNQDTRMKQMINSNRMLQQEVDFLKVSKSEQLRNVLEVQHGLRCEMEKHRAKHEDEMRELQDKCDHLKADLHELEKGQKHPDIIKMKAKYNFQLEELQSIVKNCQAENKKLQQELESLRRHMGKNNNVVPEKSQTAATEHSSKNPSQDLPEENNPKNIQVTSTQGVQQGSKSPSGAP